MKSGLTDWLLRLRASYWFIPSVMAIAAILAAFLMVQLDVRLGESLFENQRWLYANQPEGARALLSTVAGSMVTVAGVTFSMTLLAVSHASSQFGPRLLTGFMRDRGNQFTLGTFIATFLYCLIVLRTVHASGGNDADTGIAEFVPHLALFVAVALAILSVMVLIYFIHHVPQSISVSNVIAQVGDELVHRIEYIYPEKLGKDVRDERSTISREALSERPSTVLAVRDEGGYLRVLDTDLLLELTQDHDLVVELYQRPGDFVVRGQALMRVWPKGELDEELEESLRSAFSWGIERTREQDVMFSVEQLMEVLGKAMSPGVNGQHTALLCLDQLERALAEMLRRRVPSPQRLDDNGDLRVITRPVTQEEFVVGIFHPLRQYIRGDWITTSRVQRLIDRLRGLPSVRHAMPLLEVQASLVRKDAAESQMAESAKRMLQ